MDSNDYEDGNIKRMRRKEVFQKHVLKQMYQHDEETVSGDKAVHGAKQADIQKDGISSDTSSGPLSSTSPLPAGAMDIDVQTQSMKIYGCSSGPSNTYPLTENAPISPEKDYHGEETDSSSEDDVRKPRKRKRRRRKADGLQDYGKNTGDKITNVTSQGVLTKNQKRKLKKKRALARRRMEQTGAADVEAGFVVQSDNEVPVEAPISAELESCDVQSKTNSLCDFFKDVWDLYRSEAKVDVATSLEADERYMHELLLALRCSSPTDMHPDQLDEQQHHQARLLPEDIAKLCMCKHHLMKNDVSSFTSCWNTFASTCTLRKELLAMAEMLFSYWSSNVAESR